MYFGAKDIMLNATEAIERYERLVSNARTVLLPDKGHALTGFADEILTFGVGNNRDF